jgi:hypothetical protein
MLGVRGVGAVGVLSCGVDVFKGGLGLPPLCLSDTRSFCYEKETQCDAC